MTTGTELATAWIRLVPSAEGIEQSLTKELSGGGVAEKAGTEAGKKWGGGLKKGIVALGIGAAAIGAIKGLYDIGSTFDDVSDTIRVGTGATGKNLEALNDVAKNVGKEVPASFSDIGSTVADLNTTLGYSGKPLEQITKQVLQLGKIDGTAVNVRDLSASLTGFNVPAKDASGALDDLYRIAQATGVPVNELTSTLKSQGGVLGTLGFSLQDSASLLGSLSKAGVNAQGVTASMSKGLVTLAKDGEKPADAFKRVSGELQGFVDKGDDAKALDLASQVFGTRGAAQFVAALKSGKVNMEDMMGATGATSDTILGAAADTADFAEKAQVLGNQAQIALEPLANAVFNAMGDALTGLMPVLTDFGDWLGENTQAIAVLAIAIGVILVAAFIAWTASIWASTAALLESPVTWIILAIVALIAAVVLLVMNWDTVVKFITDVWSGFISWMTDVTEGFYTWWNGMWAGFASWVVDVWNGFIGWIVDVWNGFIGWMVSVSDGFYAWWNGMWTGFAGFVTDVWNGFVGWIMGVWSGFVGWLAGNLAALQLAWNMVWSAISATVSTIWSGIIGVIKSVGTAIASWWNGFWSAIVLTVSRVFGAVSSVVSGIINGVSGVFRSVGGTISGWWNGFWNGLITAVHNIFGGIGDWVGGIFRNVLTVVKAPLNGLISLINGVIDGLNAIHVTIPDWVPGVGGNSFGFSIGHLPHLADGATVLPRPGGTLAVLGEAGRPETVVDTGLMNKTLESMSDGGSGSRAAVQIMGDVHTTDVGEFFEFAERKQRVAVALAGSLGA